MYVLVLTSCNTNPYSVLASASSLEVVKAKMHELYSDTTPNIQYTPCEYFDQEFLAELSNDNFKIIDGVRCYREFFASFEGPVGSDKMDCPLVESHTLNEFTKEMADPLGHYSLGCKAHVSIIDCSVLYDETTGLFDWNTFHRTIFVY